MKTRLIVALAAGLAIASQARAQVVTDQTGPSGSIGWSSSAIFCKLLPNSAQNNFNYVSGFVRFANTAYGTIGLACTMPGIMDGLTPSDINYFAFKFLNASGQTGGCTVGAYFVDRTTGLNSGWSSGRSFNSPVWTANIPLTTNTWPLNLSHLYEVDIYLYRPQTAVGVCNPAAYGMYMENIIP